MSMGKAVHKEVFSELVNTVEESGYQVGLNLNKLRQARINIQTAQEETLVEELDSIEVRN